MGIGLKLKEILRIRGITIKRLSEITGISINTLYSITKRDSENVDPVILAQIASALGVSIAELKGVIAVEGINTKKVNRMVSDDDIKFALFGGKGNITDAMYEEVKSFAEYVRQREEKRAAAQKKTKN